MSFDEWNKSLEQPSGFEAWNESLSAPTAVLEKPLDPNVAYERAGEVWDMSEELEIPTREVENSFDFLDRTFAEPEIAISREGFLAIPPSKPSLPKRAFKKLISGFASIPRAIETYGGLGKLAIAVDQYEDAARKDAENLNLTMEQYQKLSFRELAELRREKKVEPLEDNIVPSIKNIIRQANEEAKPYLQKREQEVAYKYELYGLAPPPKAETMGEYMVDVPIGVSVFVAKLAILKKMLGGMSGKELRALEALKEYQAIEKAKKAFELSKSVMAWELLHQSEGGSPGVGAVTCLALSGVSGIPASTFTGKGIRLAGESGVLAGITAASGGSKEDVIIAALIPVGLRAWEAGVKYTGEARTRFALKRMRTEAAKSGFDFSNIPDKSLKVILDLGKQAKWWQKQYTKGKITAEVRDMRIGELRDKAYPIATAIAKEAVQPPPAKAKEGAIQPREGVKLEGKPSGEAVIPPEINLGQSEAIPAPKGGEITKPDFTITNPLGGGEIPVYVQNKTPTMSEGDELLETKIVRQGNKAQNVYRVSAIKKPDGEIIWMAEKKIDISGSAARIDARFERLSSKEYDKLPNTVARQGNQLVEKQATQPLSTEPQAKQAWEMTSAEYAEDVQKSAGIAPEARTPTEPTPVAPKAEIERPAEKGGEVKPIPKTPKELNEFVLGMESAFKMKDGTIIETGYVHALPDGVNPKDIAELGFTRPDTKEFLTREQAEELVQVSDSVDLIKQAEIISNLPKKEVPENAPELVARGEQKIPRVIQPLPSEPQAKQAEMEKPAEPDIEGQMKLEELPKTKTMQQKIFDEAIGRPKKQKPIMKDADISKPKDILGGVDPLTRITNSLKKAKKIRPLTEAMQKEARKKRVGAAAGALESSIQKGTPAEKAIFESTGLLKGPLTEYERLYEPIRDMLEPEAIDAGFRHIYNNPNLRYFEVLDTATAFKKLIDGASLTPREADLIQNAFGVELGEIASGRVPKSSLYDRIVAIWKAGLLTGIKTSGLNTYSNFFHGITETIKDIPAVAVDKVVSLYTGKQTIALQTRGLVGGTKEGFSKGWRYLKTGYDERNVGIKLDYKRVNFGDSKFAKGLQAYEEAVFHLLGAEDQPFYYAAKARSLFSQAAAQAKNKGLKGTKKKAFIENLIKNPTDEMLKYATIDAEAAVFQNRTMLGDIAKTIQRAPGGEVIVPFGRTPSAVAMQIVNYSPVGGIKTVVENIGKNKFDQRIFSQGIGRATIGTGVLFVGFMLLRKGLMTLDRPRSEKERKLWEVEGRSANSIKIGGKWRKAQNLGPAGNVLLIGGHFANALQEEGSPTKAMTTALAGGAKSFSEQTFVTGLNRTAAAIADPERSFETFFSSLAGSAVPTIVADTARALDSTERRTAGPIQRIQGRIPILRELLEPRIDVFGQDLPRYGGNPLEVMIDPTRPVKIKQDIIVDELRRLYDLGIKVSPTLLGDKNGYKALTAKENTRLWQRAGQLTYSSLFMLINERKYSDLSNEAKGKAINKTVKACKDAARIEAILNKLNTGTSIEDLYESKLLNKELLLKMIK